MVLVVLEVVGVIVEGDVGMVLIGFWFTSGFFG